MIVPMESSPSANAAADSTSRRPLLWLLSCGIRGRLVVVALMLQIMVPLVALGGEPPTRFGFQMYSGFGGTRVEARDSAGELVEIDLGDLLHGSMRPELDWTQRLPEQVCDRVPGVATVKVERSSKQRTISCY